MRDLRVHVKQLSCRRDLDDVLGQRSHSRQAGYHCRRPWCLRPFSIPSLSTLDSRSIGREQIECRHSRAEARSTADRPPDRPTEPRGRKAKEVGEGDGGKQQFLLLLLKCPNGDLQDRLLAKEQQQRKGLFQFVQLPPPPPPPPFGSGSFHRRATIQHRPTPGTLSPAAQPRWQRTRKQLPALLSPSGLLTFAPRALLSSPFSVLPSPSTHLAACLSSWQVVPEI